MFRFIWLDRWAAALSRCAFGLLLAAHTAAAVDPARVLSAQPALFQVGRTNYAAIQLRGAGDENALGFTVTFNPLAFKFVEARLGGESALLQVNSTQAASGAVGVAIAKPPPETFSAGVFTLVEIGLAPLPGFEGTEHAIGFSDQVVVRETADALANELPTAYSPGAALINGPPSLAPLADISSPEDTPVSVGISVADAQTGADPLVVTVSSSNASLLPSGSLTLTGSGAARALHFTPATNQFGATTITVIVSDGVFSTNRSFLATITPLNDAPILSPDLLSALEDSVAAYSAADLLANDAPGPANESAELLTITAVGPLSSAGGTVSLSNGVVRYLPPTNFFGADLFSYTITDNGLSAGIPDPRSASQTVTVNVERVNAAPLFDPAPAQTISELSPFTLTLKAVDPDAEPVIYSLGSGAPPGVVIDPQTGVLSWTPAEAQGPGVHSIQVIASDTTSPVQSAFITLSITVQEANTAPTLAPIADASVFEHGLLTINPVASDADIPANTLAFSLTGAPGGMSIDPGTGEIQWSPNEAQAPGLYTVTLTVTDNGLGGLSASRTFVVTALETNSAPVVLVADQTAIEGQTLRFNIPVADTDLPPNAFVFALSNAPAGMIVSATGEVSFTPDETQGGFEQTVTAFVTDNGSPALTGSAEFKITVLESNSPPVLSLAAQTISEGSPWIYTIPVTDPDIPATPIGFTLQDAPPGLTLVGARLEWTPSEGQGPGVYTFSVTATDGGSPAKSATGQMAITVTEINSAPVSENLPLIQVQEGELVSRQIPAVDSDLPPNTLLFSLIPPSKGAVSAAGLFTWQTGEADGPSTNQISIRITDNGNPALATTNAFTVIVTESNSAPVLATLPDATIAEHTLLTIAPVVVDADLPVNQLSFALLTAPPGMSIDALSGKMEWTPTEAHGPGVYSVEVKVTDNGVPALSATRSFTVTVTEVNAAPALASISDRLIIEGQPLLFSVAASDSDIPANNFSYALQNAPAGMSINSSGQITFTPSELQGGTAPIVTVQVTDNGAPPLSAQASFKLTILETNSPPSLSLANQTIPEGIAWIYPISFSDPDIPANTVSLSLESGPAGMELVNGELRWTPSELQGPGQYLVTLVARDNGAPPKSVSAQLTVTVTEANRAPSLFLANQTVAEGSTLLYVPTVEDADLPANTLTFKLENAPSGMVISPSGAITWTPTEQQGPGEYLVRLEIRDNGVPEEVVSGEFRVTVTEVNAPPVFIALPNRSVPELVPLSISIEATDSDIPVQAVALQLIDGPVGMSFDSTARLLTWTPTEAQGPGNYLVRLRARDAAGAEALASFQIEVLDINHPPELLLPGTQTILAGAPRLVDPIVISDADAGSGPILVGISCSGGGVFLSVTNGLQVIQGSLAAPSTNLVFQSTLSEATAALAMVLFAPAPGPLGESAMRIVVNDLGSTGSGQAHEVSGEISFIHEGVNTPPQLLLPGPQLVPEGTRSSFNVQVSDAETAPGAVVVTAASRSPLLIPNNSIVVTGAGARRSIEFVPSAGLTGEAEVLVRARDAAGVVTEGVVKITLHAVPPLVAVHPPESLTLIEGETLGLEAMVTGTPALLYQWLHGEEEIPGATNAALFLGPVNRQDAGAYRLRIRNPAGTAFTTATELAVQVPPSIVTQPQGGSFGEGATVRLQVTARGDGPFSYQWFKDGAPLEGAVFAALTLTNVSEAQEGAYRVDVRNAFASVVSDEALVVVEQAPRIAAQPSAQTVIEGNSASLTVLAHGTQPLRYSWFKNGQPLSVTNSTLSIAFSTTNDAALYTVRVTNNHGAVLSLPAELRVLQPVRITRSPESTTKATGTDAALSVEAVGTGPLLYQWLKNNAPLQGQTNAVLSLENLTFNDSGEYKARVANEAGAQHSASAILTVMAPPSVAIDGPTNRALIAGENLTFRTIVSGTEPLSHQWLRNDAPIPGASTRLLPLFNAQTNDAGAYTLVVTNAAGSARATLTLAVHAPVQITSQPADVIVKAGDPALFQAGVSGSAPIQHQWFFNGAAITNQTNASLSLSSAQLVNDGKYKVRVTNPAGAIQESREASLTVAVAPVITRQPAAQTVLEGAPVLLEVVISGTTSSYQWFRNNTLLPGETNSTLLLPALTSAQAGAYQVRVSNFAGSAQSDAAQVTLLTPARIVTAPASASILAGQPHQLSVAVEGSEPITFQWLFNGSPIPGATARAFTIADPESSLTRTDSGEYSVRVRNPAATVISEPADIFVVNPVSFIFDPISAEVMEGRDTFLSVLVNGSEPITYQWRKDGVNLEGETNQYLQLPSVTLDTAGTYDVIAANDLSSATSIPAVLTVLQKPRVATLPFETFLPVGAPLTLTASATGAQPLTYQWTLNGAPISGATNSSLSISSAQPTNSGAYAVIVANSGGAVASNPSVILVEAPTVLLRDKLEDALITNTPAGILRGDNFRATADAGEEHLPGIPARRTVWLTWQAPSSGIAAFSTVGSAFDTTLSIYRGPRGATSAMQRVGMDEDSGPWLTSELTFNAVAGEQYHVSIDGFNGAEGYALVSWRLDPTQIALPRILQPPLTYVGLEGTPHEFAVVAESPDNHQLGYQWSFNGAAIPNATNAFLRLPSLSPNNVGSYRVFVRNGVETGQAPLPTVAFTAHLQLTTEPELVGNVPAAEDKITFTNIVSAPLRIGSKPIQQLATVTRGYSGAQVFSTTDALRDPSEPQHCGVVGGASSWWLYTPPANGVVRIRTEGSSFDTVLAVYTVSALNFESLVSVACDNDSGPNKSSVVTFDAAANQTYFVVVDGVNGASGTVKLAYELSGLPQIIEEPGVAGLSGVGDLQAFIRTPTIQRSVAEGSALTLRVIATNSIGSAPLTYQWKRNGVVIPGAAGNTLPIAAMSAAMAGDYQAVVSNFAGSVASRVVRLSVAAPALIQSSPQDVTVSAGASASFTVVAIGSGPITYQWKFNDAVISGATTPTYTVPRAQPSDAGRYTVEVRNAFGAASASATLSILGAPMITRQPSSSAVIAGGSVTLSVEASGSQPLAYQWRFKGVNLPGQTGPSLTLTDVQPLSAGDYTVVVSNVVRSVVSDTVQLSVNVPAFIVEPPVSQSVLVNQSAAFTVNARGTAPLNYQWLFNGAPIPGANGPALILDRVSLAQHGQYSVRVGNVVNSVTSAAAALNVLAPPSITQQPASAAARAGSSAAFSVTAAGTGPLRYQWRLNGADLAGATNPVLVIPSVSAASAGSYSVAVANDAVTVVSQLAQLTVTEPPFILQQPEGKSVLAGNSVTLQVVASGPGPLLYQWLRDEALLPGQTNASLPLPNLQPSANGSYQVIVSNSGGSVSSILALVRALVAPAITEQPKSQSVAIGQNALFSVSASGSAPLRYQWRFNGAPIAGATNSTLAISQAAAHHAGAYSVFVSNEAGAVSSANSQLSVVATPVIVQQPQPRTVTAGSSASFTVGAFGAQPLHYQWFFNGLPISGATTATFVLNNAQQASAGQYTVRVSNSAGSVLSAPAVLALGQAGDVIRTTDAALLLNGAFRLKISGPRTGAFQLLASPDLRTWEIVATFSFVNGLFEHDDLTAAQRSGRFYRVVQAP